MKTLTMLALALAVLPPVFVTSAGAVTNTVQVYSFDFGVVSPPSHIDPTINVGDTVEWVWADPLVMQHSTTAAAGQAENWDSGVHQQPFSFTHTFTHAGDFAYYCEVHGADNGDGTVAGMSGHVIVNAIVVSNSDVQSYFAAAKGQMFDQLTNGAPALSATGFAFHADVLGIQSSSITSANVQIPGGAVRTLARATPGSPQLQTNDEFLTKALLDAAYSNGTYTLTIDTANSGTFAPALNLPTDAYPNTPQIANLDAAQSLVASNDFTLTWLAFTGGTTNDFISVAIGDNTGNGLFNTPDAGQPGALDGTVTSVVVPGGTLQPGASYHGQLVFTKATGIDTNSVPNALGLTAYFAQTEFAVTTVGTTICTYAISPTNTNFSSAGGSGSVDVITTNGCAWSAANNDAFVTVATNGVGSAVVTYAVAPNDSTSARSGTVTIAGQTLTISQDGRPAVADVALGKTASASAVLLGSNVTYTITVTNLGPDAAADVLVTDPVPPPLTIVSTMTTVGTITSVNNNVTAAIGPLAAGAGASITIGATPTAPGDITNVATVATTSIDGNASNNTSTSVVTASSPVPVADLAITKTASPDSGLVNSNFTYTLVVTNLGPASAMSVVVTDQLANVLTFVSATASPGTVTTAGAVVTANLGTLSPGAGGRVTITVRAGAAGDVTNTASVSSVTGDFNPGNNTSTIVTSVKAVHDLAVTRLLAPSKIRLTARHPSAVARIAVRVQNLGPQAETIPDLGTLTNVVSVIVESLGTNCAPPAAHVVPPNRLPIVLQPGRVLTVRFTPYINCANDPLATTRTAGHNDYRYTARVQHAALDGNPDTQPANDACPRPPNPAIGDQGCGNVDPNTRQLGGDVVTDVIQR